MCRCFGGRPHEEKLTKDEAIGAITYRLCKENPQLDPVKAVELAEEFINMARNLRVEMYEVENNRVVGLKHAYEGNDPYGNFHGPTKQ
jgi:hypothetical protein